MSLAMTGTKETALPTTLCWAMVRANPGPWIVALSSSGVGCAIRQRNGQANGRQPSATGINTRASPPKRRRHQHAMRRCCHGPLLSATQDRSASLQPLDTLGPQHGRVFNVPRLARFFFFTQCYLGLGCRRASWRREAETCGRGGGERR
jgi:hypothetical protein